MKLRFLLLPALWMVSFATVAQTVPLVKDRPVPLLTLPEGTLQPVVTVKQMAESARAGRFRYQTLKVQDNGFAFLAPAWRGIVRLEPDKSKRDFLGNNKAGEVEALAMQTLNELLEEGWELVEVRHLVQPIGLTQTIKAKPEAANSDEVTYVSSISAGSYEETTYLLRRPLAGGARE